MIGIYQITNLKSGKLYIGQSVDVKKRIKDHIYELSHGMHGNRYLQSAWNKYGAANFVFSVLEVVPEESLTEREKYWVEFYGGYESDKLYNLREPGSKGKLAAEAVSKLSESQKKLRQTNPEFVARLSQSLKDSWTLERRKAWSDSKTGIKLSASHRRSLQEAANRRVGIPRDEEVKQKISAALKGHPVSEETRRKLSEAAKKQPRRKLTEEERKHLSQKAKENWARKKQKECQEVK